MSDEARTMWYDSSSLVEDKEQYVEIGRAHV